MQQTTPIPPRLRDIIGHARAVEMLLRALRTDRLHHAILLAGPSGIGKERIALGLAAALLCQHPETEGAQTGDACGQCGACRKAATNAHPDLTRLMSYHSLLQRELITRDQLPSSSSSRPSRDILVDQVRKLCQTLAMKPYEARGQVAIVAECDRMNTSAMNSLLKTLEEPPEGTHLILLTDRPHSLLPTIRSRCQRMDLRELDEAETRRALDAARARGVLDPGVPSDELEVAALLSGGRPGRAIEILGSGLIESRDEAVNLVAALPGMRWTDALELAKQWGRNPDQLRALIDAMELWLRDLAVQASGAASGSASIVNRDRADALREQAAQIPLPVIFGWRESLQRLSAELDRNANARLAAERCLIDLRRRALQSSGSAA